MTVSKLDASATQELLQNPPDGLVVLDVRTSEEYQAGHLPGAVMIDIYQPSFAEEVVSLDPKVPYLVYCRSGGRSAKAADFMIQNGFESVSEFSDGWLVWAEADLPFEI